MAKIIAVANQKGGVAKTSSTFILADNLASKGYKVLMVDFDSQASLTISCGIEPSEVDTIDSYLLNDEDLEEIIISGICDKENLCLIPSDITLAVVEQQLYTQMCRESYLKSRLDSVASKFDYILIDCSPSLGVLTINPLVASNYVIIPSTPEYLAYRGIDLLYDTIAKVKQKLNNKLQIAGVFVTMFDTRPLHHREVIDLIRKNYKLLGIIGTSTIVRDSILQGKSVHSVSPKHKIALQYEVIAKEIIKL